MCAKFAKHAKHASKHLEAGDGELRGEVLEDGVGEAQVALGVLKVDRVHLPATRPS